MQKAKRSTQNAERGKKDTILVCFAVKEEAAPFRKSVGKDSRVEILPTGMGRQNAERAIRDALGFDKAAPGVSSNVSTYERINVSTPRLVLSCGFAGGLDPGLKTGTVLFETEDPEVASQLEAAGAIRGRFVCSDRVATTAAEKRDLRQKSGADAVEMESQVVCTICRGHRIPAATVRVILDTAAEDLPLDFNALMTPTQELSYGRLISALARRPGKIKDLLKLQKQTRAAAERLAHVLRDFLRDSG